MRPGRKFRDTRTIKGTSVCSGCRRAITTADVVTSVPRFDPSDTDPRYAPTYYPGTPNMAEATRVPLAVSEENINISFGLIATRLVRISGQVISSDGTPAVNGMIMLLPSGGGRGGAMLMGGNGGRMDQTGGFKIPNVAPGRYQIQARVGGGGPRGGGLGGEMAKMDLTVGPEDVSGIMLITAPGAIATGTVISDTGDPLTSSRRSCKSARARRRC
jgi:hypothetical protein